MEDNKKLNDKEKEKINIERMKNLNEKFEEIKERQESELTYDFDAALVEYASKQEKFTVKFLGKVYELPESMPFNFQTFFLRYCYKKIDGKMVIVMPDDKVLVFIKLMFGGKFLSALETTNNINVSIKFVNDIIVPGVLKKWGYDVSKENIKELQKKISTQGL